MADSIDSPEVRERSSDKSDILTSSPFENELEKKQARQTEKQKAEQTARQERELCMTKLHLKGKIVTEVEEKTVHHLWEVIC
jgi:hypothetical protein